MNLEISFSIEGQSQQTIPLRDRMLIGTLLSNDVVIRSAGVEPIHAMIEILESDKYVLTDLGSESGVFLNGSKIDVEKELKAGDKVTVGGVEITVQEFGTSSAELGTQAGLPPVPPPNLGGDLDTEGITPPAVPEF